MGARGYINTYKGCINIISLCITILGVMLSLLLWRITPNTTISVGWLIISILAFFIVFIVVIAQSIFLYSKNCDLLSMSTGNPRVTRIYPPKNDCFIIYTTKSLFFTKDLDVTVCICDNEGCERVACYAKVVHVQDKAMQISVSILDSNFKTIEQLFDYIKEDSKDNIKIFPGKVRI